MSQELAINQSTEQSDREFTSDVATAEVEADATGEDESEEED